MTATKTIAFCAAATLAIAAASMMAGDAQARRSGGSSIIFEQHYTTKGPVHGYSGFIRPGIYCDYQRIPNRVCTVSRDGKERCRIESGP